MPTRPDRIQGAVNVEHLPLQQARVDAQEVSRLVAATVLESTSKTVHVPPWTRANVTPARGGSVWHSV